MRPKGIENLTVFSAKEVKRVAAKKRKRDKYSIAGGKRESKQKAKQSQQAF